MDVSRFLGKVIGFYLIIISTAIFVNLHQFVDHVNNLINDQSLMFVTGFFTLILGLLAIVSHNIWQWNWRVIITLIAWITLIKGLSIILYPQFMHETSLLFLQNMSFLYIAAGVDFVLGILLVYFGFRR